MQEGQPHVSRHWSRSLNAMYVAAIAVFVGSFGAPEPVAGQSSGPRMLALLVQDGLRYSEQRRFSEAINALEEAWERDPSSPIVAEHLALAYLYERIPPAVEALTKARDLMRFSLEHGGQAVVFVQHLHSGLRQIVGSDNHCSGRLVFNKSEVYYRPSLTEHSFTLSSEELQSIVPAKSRQASSAGGLILRARNGTRHRIRAGTLTRYEAEIVLQLIREFLLGG